VVEAIEESRGIVDRGRSGNGAQVIEESDDIYIYRIGAKARRRRITEKTENSRTNQVKSASEKSELEAGKKRSG